MEAVLPPNLLDDTADTLIDQSAGVSHIKDRLVALEKSMERIERMLKRVCVEFGDEELVKHKVRTPRRENEDESLE